MQPIDGRSADAVKTWLAHWMASELNLDAAEIDSDRAFLSYGMDSMHAMMLVGDLEGSIGTRLSPTLAWDYPNVTALAGHIVEKAGVLVSPGKPGSRVPLDQASPAKDPDARAILAQLDGMSEEELDSLLLQYTNAPSQSEQVGRAGE